MSMLVEMSKARERDVHAKIKKLVESLGGRYKKGPLKTPDRILATPDGTADAAERHPHLDGGVDGRLPLMQV